MENKWGQTRTCKVCGMIKDVDDFYTTNNGMSRLYTCKRCYVKKNNQRDRERRKAVEGYRPRKIEVDTRMVKPFHLRCLNEFGNTVISNVHNKECIVESFRQKGYHVTLREPSPIRSLTGEIEESCYIVEVVKYVK